ncbi:hypothetical protein HPP92_004818 [Vanilla planifolia]|uniref:BHLH domain-containing protein n=1 Tax=Vanilla planifolia TaxID=51239 RepID=A0A835RFN2_VANPL|nr:hypothetical protein HPP92_004818 [Vanilla planifolia]
MSFAYFSESVTENACLSFMGLSNATLFPHQQVHNPFPVKFLEQITESGTEKKRKPATAAEQLMSSASTSPGEEDKTKRRKDGLGKSERKGRSKKGKPPSEVVHVRARRGQATDSHSLAERLRRRRINERLRYLQALVPGCYKAMGTATILEEIINYVRSLQNQVEFLSMKLSAASFLCDFNSVEARTTTQKQGHAHGEAHDVETSMLMAQDYVNYASFHSNMSF